MKMKKLKKLRPHFDVKILENLTQDETSCIEKLRTQHHLGLHPFHLNNLRDSIKDILDKGLSKYSKELDGILCGYNNINIINQLAKLFDDSCFIHLDIEADFYIFKPTVGKVLNGVVNKISNDHIGCLVHKTFNVSIPKPAKDRNWLGVKVQLGSEIILEIEHTDFDGLLPYIRGKITSVLTQPEESDGVPLKKRTKKRLSVSFSEDIENSVAEEPPKKRKKKDKQDDSDEEAPKKRKKSKRANFEEDIETEKHQNGSLLESDTSLSDKKLKKIKSELVEDDSETVPKKKHKKIKSEFDISENDSTCVEVEMPKKKKHKIKTEINHDSDSVEASWPKEEYVESISKKKKLKRDVLVDEEESPKKKKVKRELDFE